MKQLIILIVIGIGVAAIFGFVSHNAIPTTWDMEAIKRFHLPPADTSVQVVYAPKAYYDSLPQHVIYKTYPVYYREFEKPGYLDSLRGLRPEIAFDPSQLKTKEDWIKAGELVFNWPVAYTPIKD